MQLQVIVRFHYSRFLCTPNCLLGSISTLTGREPRLNTPFESCQTAAVSTTFLELAASKSKNSPGQLLSKRLPPCSTSIKRQNCLTCRLRKKSKLFDHWDSIGRSRFRIIFIVRSSTCVAARYSARGLPQTGYVSYPEAPKKIITPPHNSVYDIF